MYDDVIEKALAALDLDTKTRLLAGQDMWTLPGVAEIGLAPIVMSDGPIGVRGQKWTGDAAIALPSPTAQAASWDPGLAEENGRLLAQEARRKGVHVLLAPTVNLHRSPLGGRHFEGFSEDPYLTGQMAAAFVRGVQSGGVATTVKHFVANDAETDRMSVDNIVGERALRELYLAPFETVVKEAGAWGVMAAYNAVNGASMTTNGELQNGVLRGEWGFDGFIVSDWTASRDTVGSAMGGTDVAMPGPVTVYGEALAAAVREGRVPEEVVDAMVRRVLLLAARVGALAGAPAAVGELPARIDGPAQARRAAARSFVLARNDGGLLPLAGVRRIAVSGMAAREPRVMGGGSAQVFVPSVATPLDALREALPGVEIDYRVGADARTLLPPYAGAATATARDAAGNVLVAEELAESRVAWMGELPAGLDPAALATVELRATIVPDESGEHVLSLAGAGMFTLVVDGERLFEGPQIPEGDDPVAAFISPPETRFAVAMTAGTPVEVAVTAAIDPRQVRGPLKMVFFTLGHSRPVPDEEAGLAEAAEAARGADVAIVFVNTTEAVESEGFDRKSLALPGRQDDLVSRVAAANGRTIVVVTAGAPVEMPWLEEVPAVLLTWFGGQEFAPALAAVLTGAEEPGGRLPTTWPRRLSDAPVSAVVPTGGKLVYEEGVFIGYRAWERRDAVAPAFWFGHGLGYTTWDYADIAVDADDTAGESLGTVRVTVDNEGGRAGREVVQVYLEPVEADEERPARWLAGFAAVEAAAGEGVEVHIPIPARAAQVWENGGWVTRRGAYVVHAGRSVADLRLSAVIEV
ncbi:beta-glucosidase [Actinorhabdospora filicis]|uniref:Beta-glucosidase n=1 Tax=Actinorhabdospora filicis TaxID=1785913 RepID=A0A9W6WAR7_9ACTN|nr:glycoside hydrolase family 3 C-terminal domain-containing protein [Actinorhabdospora filicis]GLZ79298.1 beta-glucosidase [Actinorhabdospora filicis]